MVSPEARQYLKYAITEGIVTAFLVWSLANAPIQILPADLSYSFVFIFALVTLSASILGLGEEVGQRFSGRGKPL